MSRCSRIQVGINGVPKEYWINAQKQILREGRIMHVLEITEMSH